MKEFIALGSEEPGEPMVTVEESEGKIVLDYFFPGFFLVDSQHEIAGEKMPFKQVMVSSTGSMCESGKPQIPSLGRYLQVPPGCDYDVSLDTGRAVAYDPVLVWPAQMKMTDAGDKEHVFEFDKEFYSTDGPYPKQILQVKGPFNIGETNALLVHVAPLQYGPKHEQLLGYSNIKVTIAVRPRLEGNPEAVPGTPGERETFDNLFLNPGKGIEERLGFPPRRPFIKGSGPEFLIIYADIFKQAAEKLAYWKNSRGLLTEVVSMSEVLSTNTSGSMVVTLKDYIRRRRAKAFSRLRYVLLFGDIDTIEAEIIPRLPTDSPSKYGDNITDYYYSTEDDSDPPKANSLFSPLAIGRIPVIDPAEAMGVVGQIIDYEKNPPGDPDYYKRMVFSAAFADDPDPPPWPLPPDYDHKYDYDHKEDRRCLETVEYIRSRLQLLGYVGERVYICNSDNVLSSSVLPDTTSDPVRLGALRYQNDDLVPADVLAAMLDRPIATQKLIDATTEGQLIICNRGHGGWDGWCDPEFTNTDLGQVTGCMPSIFFSINCSTGDLEWNSDCFAEMNLKMKGAAPSLIAATEESNNYLNNYLILALFDATFTEVLPTIPKPNIWFPVRIRRLGDILNYGKSYLPIAARTDTDEPQYIKDHFEVYHVIGDPTLELWTKFPGIITVDASLTLYFIDIILSTCPRGCVLTIWHKKTILKRIEPLSTRIIVPAKHILLEHSDSLSSLRSDFESNLRVCCWAPEYRYCETKVRVE